MTSRRDGNHTSTRRRGPERSFFHIWFSRTDELSAGEQAEAAALLSTDERDRAARFRFAYDRREFVVAHALLRTSLSRYAAKPPEQWQFGRDRNGKPRLETSGGTERGLTFSLTHARGLVACVVAAGETIGVDAERIDRTHGLLALRRVCAADEIRDLACATVHRPHRLCEIWTLKEAYVKAIGFGLSYPLDQIAFHVDETGTIRFDAKDVPRDARWQFAVFAPTAEHRLAVAIHAWSARPVRVWAQAVQPDGGPSPIWIEPYARSAVP